MKLIVKTLNAKVEKTLVLNVELDYEVWYVKCLIIDQTDIAFDNQQLLHNGREMDDSSRLIDCDIIRDSTTIRLLLIDEHRNKSQATSNKFIPSPTENWRHPQTSSNKLKVTVEFLTGKKIEFGIAVRDRVEDLKKKIAFVEGTPKDQQRLIFDGKQMQDDKSLYDYGVKENSVIHLVLRLRGGLDWFVGEFRLLTGKTISIPQVGYNNGDTPKKIIEQIWKAAGTRAGNQLLFKGTPLNNDHRFGQYQELFEEGKPRSTFNSKVFLELRNQPPARPTDKIYVKFSGDKTRRALVLDFKPSDSVRSLKPAIHPELRVHLKLAGEDSELENDRKLSDYGIQSETMLYGVYEMKLFVRSLDNGMIVRFVVNSCDRIASIKEKIQTECGISTDVQVLSLGTRRLDNAESIIDVFYGSKPVLGLEASPAHDLQIQIRDLLKSISLSIKSNETIEVLKRRIAGEVNCLPDQQHLYFNGEQLVDSCRLDRLEIRESGKLCFVWRSNVFKISIVPVGTSWIYQFEVEVNSHDTVKFVKSKIEQRSAKGSWGYALERQVLTYAGKQLEDDRTLLNYGIGNGASLELRPKVGELEISIQTEFVEKRVLKVRSDSTKATLKSEIKKLGLSICVNKDCSFVDYSPCEDLSELLVGEPLMITQREHCNNCSGCAKIKEFKLFTGLN